MSDALSRTIPMVIASLNFCLFELLDPSLSTSFDVKEYARIISESGLLTREFIESIGFPFKVFFVYPGSAPVKHVDPVFTPIYLVNASSWNSKFRPTSADVPRHFKVSHYSHI